MADAASQGPLLAALSTSLLLSTAALALLVVPWPKYIRAPLLRALAHSSLLELLAKPVIWFFALVAATCVYHTRAVRSLQAAYHAEKKHGDIGQKLLHEAVMFRAERDWLISAGAALSLLGALSAYCFALVGRACAALGVTTYREAWEKGVDEESALTADGFRY